MRSSDTTESARCPPALERHSAVVRMLELLFTWAERSRSRDRLAMLDERYLKDIGLSRYDVQHETRKWFWQR